MSQGSSGGCVLRLHPAVVVFAVFLPAILARWLLANRFPLLLTADSSDFLVAAASLFTDLGAFSDRLRDWRLPGYPAFLAVVHALAPWRASSLLWAQAGLGLATVGFGLAAGRRLAGVWGMGAVGLLLALHPGYLLQEHMVMAETLFQTLLWAVVWLAIRGAATPSATGALFGACHGLLLGGLTAACLLTRSNGLFLCAPVVVGTIVVRLLRQDGTWARRLRRELPFLVIAGLAFSLLLGLWIVRNQARLGEPKLFTDNVYRSRIVYLAERGLLQPDLPRMAPYDYDPARPVTAYDLMLHQLPASGAEDEARAIVREQIAARPSRYLTEMQRSARRFLGMPVDSRCVGCRDMEYWLIHFVGNVEKLHLRHPPGQHASSSLLLDREGRSGRILRAWSRAGIAYLHHGRPALTLLTGLSLLAWLVARGLDLKRRGSGRRGVSAHDVWILALAAGLACVVFGHAWILADHDRYAVPFDGYFLLLAVACWASVLGKGTGADPGADPGAGDVQPTVWVQAEVSPDSKPSLKMGSAARPSSSAPTSGAESSRA